MIQVREVWLLIVNNQKVSFMMCTSRIYDEASTPPDKSAYWKTVFFISHPKPVVGTQNACLN